MRKQKYLLALIVLVLGMTSCYQDTKLGEPIEILDDYTLPQTGASDAANTRIKSLYDKYGSYFLYDFTDNDAFWKEVTGRGNSSFIWHVVKGDPKNVDQMLDLLQDAWLKYFPNDILAKGGIPYRVFLADSVYQTKDYGGGYIRVINYNVCTEGSNSIIIAGLDHIPTMSQTDLTSLKTSLFATFFNSYIEKGYIKFPDEFYSVSDYVNCPTYERVNATTMDDYRGRGFAPTYEPNYGGYFTDWFSNTKWYSTWKDAKANDRKAFLSLLLYVNDANLESYLAYPAIKKKFDILVDFYKNNYNIDVRAVANGK